MSEDGNGELNQFLDELLNPPRKTNPRYINGIGSKKDDPFAGLPADFQRAMELNVQATEHGGTGAVKPKTAVTHRLGETAFCIDRKGELTIGFSG